MVDIFLHLDSVCYSLMILCSLYTFILFVIWWRRVGSVSYVYKVLTVLLLGILIQNLGNLFSVLHKHTNDVAGMVEILHSWWWPLRLIPSTLCLIAFVIHFSWRFSHMDRNGVVQYGRRRDD